jgi:uncharacterized MAPEG superfamily protein
MAPELQLLGLAVIVGIVQLVWAAVAARRQQSLAWAAGPRDEPMPISGVAARLDRAFRNFMETFPLFAAAVLAAHAADSLSGLTLWGAGLYVAGRALYVPLYASGIPRIRTLAWAVAMVGLFMVTAALFV